MIIALVPIRQYILPYIFSRHTLHELDAAEYEEALPISDAPAAGNAENDAELVRNLPLSESVLLCTERIE